MRLRLFRRETALTSDEDDVVETWTASDGTEYALRSSSVEGTFELRNETDDFKVKTWEVDSAAVSLDFGVEKSIKRKALKHWSEGYVEAVNREAEGKLL